MQPIPTGITPDIRQGDRLIPGAGAVMPLVVVLDNLRSAFNVGNILRLADAVRVEEVIACGYTAAPPHPKLAKTARGCDQTVPCRVSATAAEALQKLRGRGYRVYGIETAATARPFWDVTLQFPAAFVFGNEALGLSASAVSACDDFVALPALGWKNSINVGNCAAVMLYESLRQWLPRSARTTGSGAAAAPEQPPEDQQHDR